MNKGDYVLAFLLAIIVGLWGVFAFVWTLATPWRFYSLFFISLVVLLGISILDPA